MEEIEFKVITHKSINPYTKKISLKRNLRFLIISSSCVFAVVVFALSYLLVNLPKSNLNFITKFFINSLIILLISFNCTLIYTVYIHIKRFKNIYKTYTTLENYKTNILVRHLYKELNENTLEYITSENNPKASIYTTQSFFIYDEIENSRYIIGQKDDIKLISIDEHHKAFGENLMVIKIEYLNLENVKITSTLKLPENNMFIIILEQMGITL